MAKEKPNYFKGFKYLAMSLPLIFLGPTIFNMALRNKEHVLFVPILIISLLFLFTAIFVAVKGLRIIMKTLFEEE